MFNIADMSACSGRLPVCAVRERRHHVPERGAGQRQRGVRVRGRGGGEAGARAQPRHQHRHRPHLRGQLLQRPCQVQHPDRGLIIIIRTIDEVYIFLVFHLIVLSN